MGWLLQNFPICINKLAPGVLLSGTGPRKRTSFRSSLVLNYSVRWTNVHRPDPPRGKRLPLHLTVPRAFANNRVSGSEPLQGSRDNFPGKSTPRHLSRELSLLSFFAHTRRRRLLQPPPPFPFTATERKRGVSKERNWYRLLFSLFFFLLSSSSSSFFWINTAKVRANYLSLIVELLFVSFPPPSFHSFSGGLLNT